MEIDKYPLQDLPNLGKKEFIERSKLLSNRYRIGDGKNFRLNDYHTDDSPGFDKEDKPLIKEILQAGVKTLASMQDVLYANDKWALLLIFQGMDAAGKDGAIKHVMSGVNPQGCQVTSFKTPSTADLDHDYMWRCMTHLPERGRIGVFNRSYYEEVLIVRVHEQILRSQSIPEKLITENIWEERFQDIRHYEKYLNRNGILTVKFFLNISKKEQKKRFLQRIDTPEKNWKFGATDITERTNWKDYMNAYEEMIINTSTENSPWYVVPADNKAYARIIVASAIISALDKMELEYPKVGADKIAELQTVKETLLAE